jgi:hypothetical protein
MSQSHHKPSVSTTPQLTPIPRHNSLVVGLLLICALILMPNHSQSLGSQPAGRVNVSVFTKADRLLSNEAVHGSDPIGELIDRLSLPESPALPATLLFVTPEDVKNAFLAMSQPCDAGAMRAKPFAADRAHER